MGTALHQTLFTNSLFAINFYNLFLKFPTNIYLKLDTLVGAYQINPSNEKFINHFIYTKMKLLLMLKTISIKSTHFIQIQLKRNSLRII